jgi:hypothetical protein
MGAANSEHKELKVSMKMVSQLSTDVELFNIDEESRSLQMFQLGGILKIHGLDLTRWKLKRNLPT